VRKSKVVHGFARHFFKMLLPGSSASYGPHALQACEGTTLGVNDEFNGCQTLKQIIKDQGYLIAMSEAKLEHCKILTLL